MRRTVALIILDGWGVGPQNESNAIYVAKTPVLDGIAKEYPHTSLQASGISVGLPWGETGHSQQTSRRDPALLRFRFVIKA